MWPRKCPFIRRLLASTRVINPDIEQPKGVESPLYRPLRCFFLASIAFDTDSFASTLENFPLQLMQSLISSCCQNEISPSSANANELACPIPALAPVMRIVLFSNF